MCQPSAIHFHVKRTLEAPQTLYQSISHWIKIIRLILCVISLYQIHPTSPITCMVDLWARPPWLSWHHAGGDDEVSGQVLAITVDTELTGGRDAIWLLLTAQLTMLCKWLTFLVIPAVKQRHITPNKGKLAIHVVTGWYNLGGTIGFQISGLWAVLLAKRTWMYGVNSVDYPSADNAYL